MFNFTQLLRPKDYRGKPVEFIQPKYDGIRLLVRKFAGGHIDAWTRNGLTNHWHDLRACATTWRKALAGLPEDTALDCELHAVIGQATDVITLIKSSSSELLLTPFAMPWYVGFDWRSKPLIEVMDGLTELGFTPPPTLPVYNIPGCFDGVIYDQGVEYLQTKARREGLEGYILKGGHYTDWYKVKPVRSVDCFVTDVSLSESDSFAGGLKAIKVSVRDVSGGAVEIASVGTGFEAEYRMSVKPNELIGRVCEVSYDSVASKGKLKFPRFMRWREDKAAGECLMEQLR